MNDKNTTELERFDFQGFMESKNLPIHEVTRSNAKPNLSLLKKQTQQ